MSSSELACDGADLICSLPEDVLALISAHLRPRDLLALSAASRRLRDALSAGGADKAWLAQCRRLLPSPPHLLAWRAAAGGSSLAVCRFLHSAAPLLGLWVHQNPELGNLVVALPGFLSLVAVRSIPQELSPRLRWAPVFELLADADGRPTILFLHGHHPGALFPGLISSLHPHANVLFLDAQTGQDPVASSSQFVRLAFGDRRRLLDLLVAACRVKLPPDLAAAPLFARSDEDLPVLAARREAMLRLHRESGGGLVRTPEVQGLLLEANKKTTPSPCDGGERIRLPRSLSAVAGYVRNGLRQMVTRSVSANSRAEYADSKHLALDEFLRTGESVSLSIRGARMRLSTYHAWPSMHDNRFALYKLTVQATMPGWEYAGLWGGTFGWPPGRPEDECKPGKPLFFLLLTYEEDSEGKLLLIATKVLEGTHYVVHPNGSSMFIVRMGEPSTEAFPWRTDRESHNVGVERSFAGEGIANGYGFRYPGSKPGSLFVLQDGQLAFVWRETGAVLTLRRLDLVELLKKGERVPALQPILNFAYLTKSYSNVFTGFPGSSGCSSSPR
ncbi:F-box protein At5g39450-like [Phragmites australis]|uniref:F-box protein At5g39450-like n=1 Tax=Phragmites australis TaxID=29695 RepID=UPI002D765DD8|nr:F-box protein At5g39450-like [Phragmites australis]